MGGSDNEAERSSTDLDEMADRTGQSQERTRADVAPQAASNFSIRRADDVLPLRGHGRRLVGGWRMQWFKQCLCPLKLCGSRSRLQTVGIATVIEGETGEIFSLISNVCTETAIPAAPEQIPQGDTLVCLLTDLHPPGVPFKTSEAGGRKASPGASQA